MPPSKSKKPKCQICASNESRYTCSACLVVYCSVPCYKKHKAEDGCGTRPEEAGPSTPAGYPGADPERNLIPGATTPRDSDRTKDSNHDPNPNTNTNANTNADVDMDEDAEEPLPEDPPPLRSLASLNWPYVPEESAYPDPLKRDDPKPLQLHHYEAIATSPAIRQVLSSHEGLIPLLTSLDSLGGPERERALERALGVAAPDIANREGRGAPGEDVLALRALAEAIEAAVRGDNRAALGLNWGMDDE